MAALGAGTRQTFLAGLLQACGTAIPSALMGKFLGLAGSRALAGITEQGTLRPALDGRLTGFVIGLALFAEMGATLATEFLNRRRDLVHDLNGGGLARAERSQGLFLAIQAAITAALLACAFFGASSIRNIRKEDLGYDPKGLVLVSYLVPFKAGIPVLEFQDLMRSRQRDIMDRVQSIPGVLSCAQGAPAPLDPVRWMEAPGGRVRVAYVAPGWLRTLGATILQGRDVFPGRAVSPGACDARPRAPRNARGLGPGTDP